MAHTRGTTVVPIPRFPALALFGRRPPRRGVRSWRPASENLHKSGLMHRSKSSSFRAIPFVGTTDATKPGFAPRPYARDCAPLVILKKIRPGASPLDPNRK